MHKTEYEDSYRDNFPSEPNVHVEEGAYDMVANHVVNGEVAVPSGYYFALGDNRDASLDSRYWGFVPGENILGQPAYVYWSVDTGLDGEIRKTRWDRTFMPVRGFPLGR